MHHSATSTRTMKEFIGRWDLTLKAPDREYPSWLEIQQNRGQINALFVSRWGNARALPKVEIDNTHITFVSPKEEEDRKDDMVFEGELKGDRLSGTTTGPDGAPWTWIGVRAPALKRNENPKWGSPITLFNGQDLTGWKMSKPGPPDWTVKDGILVSPGNGPELISDAKFQDFKLHLEFNCGTNANSGVYLRGRYEVQIETESASEPASHHTGGVYGFLAPEPELERAPNVWQKFDITLIGRRVTVVQNGRTVIANREIPGITGGALDSDEALPGPIYLQGSEKGHVQFRNIVITPAREDIPAAKQSASGN
ncbi:MAG TPA: DUF1080 domain-containing protein [Terracidiphilus sp.]|nr:DUF1080 domain-containing protein [Terracidiphilus sp.]